MKAILLETGKVTYQFLLPIMRKGVELLVLLFACWLTWQAFDWSTDYADRALGLKEATEAGVALIIGAVMTPLLGFTGYIVKKYLETSPTGNGPVSVPVAAPVAVPVVDPTKV